MDRSIAIIGAGASGLAAAWSLQKSGFKVTVFEKSRGLSGRAASRTKNGVRFDHGANYFKIDSEPVRQLVLDELPTDDLAWIEKDVWTFDAGGALSPGDPRLNAEDKWTYRTGISTLGKLLAAASGAEIRNSVLVESVIRTGNRWQLRSNNKDHYGPFDAVLFTAPGPQTVGMLENSEIPPELRKSLATGLSSAAYHRQFCVVLAADGDVQRPGDFFALINSDRSHDIAWLSFENDKPGHVPFGQTVIVVQLSPAYSESRFNDDPKQIVTDTITKAADLLGCDIQPNWTDIQRWKFAHPFSAADSSSLRAGEAEGLFFSGDALVGKGRVTRALKTGLDVAERIQNSLTLFESPG